MTVQEQLLSLFLKDGIANLEMLYSVDAPKYYISRNLSKMQKKDLINKRKITIKKKNKGRKYDITYYTITEKGIEYLIKKCVNELDILRYYSELENRNIKMTYNYDRIERLLKIDTAYFYFKKISSENILNYKLNFEAYQNCFMQKDAYSMEEILKEKTIDFPKFNRLIKKKYEQDKNENGKKTDIKKTKGSVFIDSGEITSIMGSRTTNTINSQYAFSDHIGLLVSPLISYGVYHTYHNGTLWSKGAVTAIQMFLTGVLEKLKIEYRINSTFNSAIIFTKSAAEFSRSYLKCRKQREIAKKDERYKPIIMGEGYNYCHVIGETPEAIKTLRLLTSFDDHQMLNSHLECEAMLLEYDFCPTNDKNFIIEYQGKKCFLGVSFDIITLQRVEEEILKSPNEYTIICEKWQEPYYKKIMPPEVTYYIVKESDFLNNLFLFNQNN